MFIGQKIIYYSDSIVIGIIMGPAHVTFFVIGATLTDYMRRVVNQMTQMFTPLTSELQARGEKEKISDVLMLGTKMSLIIALPISIVFLTMGKRFISLWMGKEYGPLSGDVLIVLTIAHLFSVAQYTTQDILQGLNKHQVCATTRCVEAVANLVLSVVLIRHWGILGVAVGTAIPHLVTALFAFPYFISRVVNVDFRQYVFGSYLAPIFSSIPFLAGCVLIEDRFPASHLPGFFARVFLLMPLYMITVWYFSIKKQERAVYTGAFCRLAPALSRKLGMTS
jgi:O-antigen/teichoic acid export membrane protein